MTLILLLECLHLHQHDPHKYKPKTKLEIKKVNQATEQHFVCFIHFELNEGHFG